MPGRRLGIFLDSLKRNEPRSLRSEARQYVPANHSEWNSDHMTSPDIYARNVGKFVTSRMTVQS